MKNVQNGVKSTALKLVFFAVLMFGFGYALVPLYDVFCEVTGINGKTGRVVENKSQVNKVSDRLIRIQFDANINGNLPWRLKSDIKDMKVQPGKFYEATYTVENMADTDVVGQAIPSVSPQVASLYFKKSECFCFVNQLLKAGEKKIMKVRFEVDNELPMDISTLTLSYTFFKSKTAN